MSVFEPPPASLIETGGGWRVRVSEVPTCIFPALLSAALLLQRFNETPSTTPALHATSSAFSLQVSVFVKEIKTGSGFAACGEKKTRDEQL